MKVLFANRSDCFSLKGGDTVQMLKTKEYIEKLFPDIEIKIVTTPEEILNDNEAKIVHVFNIIRTTETLNFINAAKAKKKKVVLSTIFIKSVDASFINYIGRLGIYPFQVPYYIKILVIKFFNLLNYIIPVLKRKNRQALIDGLYTSNKHKKLGREILEKTDIILPNSDSELDSLIKYYNKDIKEKSYIVPNAIEYYDIENDNHKTFNQLINISPGYILQVGRIETRKNQLNLIKALKNYHKEIPIVFLGKVKNIAYYNAIKKIANKRGNVYFIDEIPHEQVGMIYKMAKVHVLPSFLETTGLVSLEAKFFGCEIVVSSEDYCPVAYYKFDKIAYLCNPYSLKSIRQAVDHALHDKKSILDDEYKDFFNYENVAKLTRETYLKLFGGSDC